MDDVAISIESRENSDNGITVAENPNSGHRDRNDAFDETYPATNNTINASTEHHDSLGFDAVIAAGLDNVPDDEVGGAAVITHENIATTHQNPNVNLAPEPLTRMAYPPHFALSAKAGMEITKCTLFRYRSNWKTFTYPAFRLMHDIDSRILLLARRRSLWTYDYDIFELQNGTSGSLFKSGSPMHVATLKVHDYFFTGCSLLKGDGRSGEELAAFSEYAHFLEKQNGEIGGIKQWKILIPPLDPDTRQIKAVKPRDHGFKSLYRLFLKVNNKSMYPPDDYHFFRSQLPRKQENDVYIMNFGDRQGRAQASSKNFKVIFDTHESTVACQVVKLESDIFSVDFRPPFNAVLAMAMALSQFHSEL